MPNICFKKYFSERQEFTDLDLSLGRINGAIKSAVSKNDLADTVVVHVVGSNGKGSTSYFIAQLLEMYGASTLLFTSPHIHNITERIRIRLQELSEDRFEELFLYSLPYIEKYKLSFFESVFMMAVVVATQDKPSFIILETGLGGKYDATNTDFFSKKTVVVTSISQDHKAFLGNKISDILADKLSVVRPSSTVFIGKNQQFIQDIIKAELPANDLRWLPHETALKAESIYPKPFDDNYQNAHRVAEYLLGKTLPLSTLLLPPCRQERFGRIILDGAHNPSGIITLLNSLSRIPDIAVITCTKDRDIKKMIQLVERKIPQIVVTTIPDNERSYSAKSLLLLGRPLFTDPIEAVKYALANSSQDVLVSGSFYMCGYVRQHILDGDICPD